MAQKKKGSNKILVVCVLSLAVVGGWTVYVNVQHAVKTVTYTVTHIKWEIPVVK